MSTPTPKEIRENFQDYRSEWKEPREQAALDMQAISVEGPWSAEDRAARESAGRPCVHLDQINQFLNQYAGNLRKNKRAIQLIPKGNGATDADAGKREGIVMGIEERSNAPSAVYIPAAESAAQRSYGFGVIRNEYRDDESFDQEILIKPITNPDTVLISPTYKQPDASDISDAFLLDQISKKDFKRKYPKAERSDFTGELMSEVGVSDWVKDKYLQIAEYWKILYDLSKLLLVETETGLLVFPEKAWAIAKEKIPGTVKRERTIEKPRVVQYLTNGLEILDEIPWAGTRIPIIACLGPERWTTEGGKAKRELLSMVRFARDPQLFFDYLATGEAEVAKKIPKVPFVGAKGQFESDKEAWEECTDVPHAFLQYDAVTDATGQITLPAPIFTPYTANFQEWEVAKDAATRALQASMGITPLPDAAQRRGQKSGVALDKIDSMESLGSFHFVDRFENGFLHNMGWQINQLIKPIIDTQRELPIAKADGTRGTIHVVGNTSHPIDEDGAYEVIGADGNQLPEDHLHTGKGDFDVTIDSGPSHDSLRDAQSEFVDQLIQQNPNLPMPGTPQAKILALGIRMRPDLGPIGKQIADVFDPPDPSNLSPEAQALVQQLKSQIQTLSQENQALHMDRAGRVLEQQTKLHIEQMRGDVTKYGKAIDYITKIITAQLAKGSKAEQTTAELDAQRELAALGFFHDQVDRAHDAAHDIAKTQLAHSNALELGQQGAANASDLASQQAASTPSNQPGDSAGV